MTLLGLPAKLSVRPRLKGTSKPVACRSGTVCMLGGFQYQRRVSRLRRQGIEVLELGNRVLQEQCYGKDVASLQQFLAEQGYLNPANDVTGYYGAITKEAVAGWQQDSGLPATGIFDQSCKWAFLQQQEAQAAQARAPVVAVAPPTPQPSANFASYLDTAPAWQIWLGAAALAVMALQLMNRPRRLQQMPSSRASASSPLAGLAETLKVWLTAAGHTSSSMLQLGLVVARRLLLATLVLLVKAAAATALASAAAAKVLLTFLRASAAAAVVVGSDLTCVVLAVREALAGGIKLRQAPVLMGPASPQPVRPSVAASGQQPVGRQAETAWEDVTGRQASRKEGSAQPAAVAARGPADAAAGGQARPQTRGGAGQEGRPRLPDAEIQRRIAAMKGENVQNLPLQRPAPKPLTDRQANGSDPFLQSKYGKYYGGRETRTQIMELLQDRSATSAPLNGPARRMQAMGYPIPERRPAPSKPRQQPAPTPPAPRQPGAPAAPAPTAAAGGGPRSALGQPLSRPSSFSVQVRGAQQGPRQQEPVLRAAASAVATPRPAFEDIAVPEPAAALRGNAVGSTALNGYPAPAATLITGTELAAVEAPRTRPVKVHRPGHDDRVTPVPAAAAAAGTAADAGAAAGPPRPVAVVKQGPLTVGEMLAKAASEDEPQQGPDAESEGLSAWQGPLYAPQAVPFAAEPLLPPGTVVAKGPIPVHKPARVPQGAELAQRR